MSFHDVSLGSSLHNVSLGSPWGNLQPIDDRAFQNFVSSLNLWSGSGNFLEAKKRITACYCQPGNNHLDLSGLGLSTLPDVIGQLVHLKVLDIKNNQFESLPSNIKNLRSLEVLNCGNNRLSSLPYEIKELSCLREFDCANNKFSRLPSEIKNFIYLQKFNCSGNQIESLPYEIKYLSCLQVLNCSNNKLSKLPYEIKDLKNLQELNCSGNQIESLPYEIKYLTCLQVLNCGNNKLSALPFEIKGLKNLREINCKNNKFTSVPLNLRGLNIEVGVDSTRGARAPRASESEMPALSIEDNARRVQMESTERVYAQIASTQSEIDRVVSEHNERLAQINARAQRLNESGRRSYQGTAVQSPSGVLNQQAPFSQPPAPFFGNTFGQFAQTDAAAQRQSESGRQSYQGTAVQSPSGIASLQVSLSQPPPLFLANIFDRFKNALPESKRDLKQLQVPTLQSEQGLWNKLTSWLDKLRLSADFTNPNTCPLIAERVLLILQMAEQNQAFRDTFFDTLKAASEGSVDKAPHHLASLEIQKAVIDSKAQSLSQLSKVLEGAFAAELLDQWAHEFVKTLRIHFFENVEVHLALQLKFRAKFQLPIGVTGMGHFRCHQLQDSDFVRAEAAVQQGLEDKIKFATFLEKQKVWTEKLAGEFGLEKENFLAHVVVRLSRLEETALMGHIDGPRYCELRERILAEQKLTEQLWLKTKTRQVLGLIPSSQITQPSSFPQSTETVITVRCKDLPLGKELFIRGSGGGLNWNQGVKLTRIDWERFEFRTSAPFSGELEYKLLIGDDIKKWEGGNNHKITQGKIVVREHTFGKEVLPPKIKTTLTVDVFLPGKTLSLCGTGPLGNWDVMIPMESVRNDHNRWYITFDGRFPDFEYKLCLDGQVEEGGGSKRVAKCGTRSVMEPVRYM
jgi:hypothetical protein